MREFEERIKTIHRKLGIPEEYESKCGIALQEEENDLVEIGNDMYGRPQRLAMEAADSWKAMKLQARKEGVYLSVVSAFRAIDKQTEIIQREIIPVFHMSRGIGRMIRNSHITRAVMRDAHVFMH